MNEAQARAKADKTCQCGKALMVVQEMFDEPGMAGPGMSPGIYWVARCPSTQGVRGWLRRGHTDQLLGSLY